MMSELYSYPSNDYRSYLAHHGVKGMKWGIRKKKFDTSLKANRRRIITGAALGAAAGLGVGAIRHPKQSIPWMDLGDGTSIVANIPTYTFGSAARHTIVGGLTGAALGVVANATVDQIQNNTITEMGKQILNASENNIRSTADNPMTEKMRKY